MKKSSKKVQNEPVGTEIEFRVFVHVEGIELWNLSCLPVRWWNGYTTRPLRIAPRTVERSVR